MISVILPVWKPKYNQLQKCLESIVNQTYSDLEIIVIYRKSDNNEPFFSLLDSFNDKRIKVLVGKSKGFVNALNEGVNASSGEIIGRIDADDYNDKTRFEKELQYMKENNLDIVGTWANKISEEGKIIGKIEVPKTHEEIRKSIMFHCPMLHPTILMKKQMLIDVGMYDESFIHAEDYELYFRIMSRNYRFGNMPEHLVNIREDQDSRSRGAEWKMQRKYYMKAKNKAFFHYGFTTPRDAIYHILTPISRIMSPKLWMKMKKFTGWDKS